MDAMPPETVLAPNRKMILASLLRQTCRWHELGKEHWLEIRLLSEGSNPIILRSRTDLGALEDIAGDIAHWNDKGRNAYSVRNPIQNNYGGNAQDKDIIAAFAAFCDCDDDASAKNLLSFVGPKYAYAITTGSTPFPRPHAYWEFEEPVTDMAKWRALQVNIAAAIGSDNTVVNPSRIMRIGGTINWPTDKKKADRGYIDELCTIREDYPADEARTPVAFDRLQRAFAQAIPAQAIPAQAAQAAPTAFNINLGPKPMDRDAARMRAMSGQEWHNEVIRVVASYVSKGLGDEEIHAITDHMTLPGYTVEQTRAEVQSAINGARRKGFAPQQQYANPSEIKPAEPTPDVSSFDAEPRPNNLEWFDDIEPSLLDGYVIKGVIGDGAMSVVYGPSNSGKTFFALDLAYHVAIDHTWRGHRVKGGSVLYLAAEGGRGLINRIAALKQEHGVCDVPLAVKRAGLDLLKSQADLQHIVDLAAEVGKRAPLRLIVVDTLSRVMAGGDENSAQDMTALIANIGAIQEATGAHICIVHHTGKDAARGARGHSSLRAATDTEIEVQVEDEARAAQVTKQRDYSGGECFAFTLRSVNLGTDNDGDDVTSCVVEASDSEEFSRQKAMLGGLGGHQKTIIDAFDLLKSEGVGGHNPGGVGFPEPGQFWCVPYDDLRRVAQGKMNGTDTGKLFRQAFFALSEKRGLICMADKLVWRTDKPKKKVETNA